MKKEKEDYEEPSYFAYRFVSEESMRASCGCGSGRPHRPHNPRGNYWDDGADNDWD